MSTEGLDLSAAVCKYQHMIQSQGVGRCFALRTLAVVMLAMTMACFFLPTRAPAAGVTIITHGWNGNVDDWIIPMAQRMVQHPSFPGTQFSCYEISVGGDYSVSQSRIGGISPLQSDSGEIIIKLDWSALSVNLINSSTDVAGAVVPRLLSTTFIPELGGRSLAEFPIHLIGHSRGGSVVSEMARLLGAQGVWVDHVTTLDPHPVDTYSDAEVYLYQNVLFADNYWQTNPNLFCPNGQSVFGAYERYLANLENGYSCGHSDVHLWYHGTLDLRLPADDSVESITALERQTWWTTSETYGTQAGFYYSRIGGGNRLSVDEPGGLGTGRVSDGYNRLWDFGAGTSGNRYALPSNNGAWPNLIQLNILGSNSVVQGEVVSLKYFRQNTQPATVTVFLDDDYNPYNGNVGQITNVAEAGLSLDYAPSRQFSFDTSATSPRSYGIFARITAGGRSRYLYTPGFLTIRPLPCSYTIAPAERSHTGGVGTGSITVTTRSDCDWTATSGCDWVHVTAGATGTGNGSVSYSIDANPTCTARNCLLTIAGRTFTVRQQSGSGTFTIAPPEASHGPGAESGSVSVTASSADCGWAAVANCSWLHITAGTSGTGSGMVGYSVDTNPNCDARNCTLTIADQTFTVNQAAGSGTFVITPNTRSHGPGAATSSVSVAAGIACAWAATNNDDWISVTAGASGTGNGLVSYAVQANSELTGRTGTVTVAGSTFTVIQAGIPPDTTKPTVSITGPVPTALFTNAHVVLTGLASDDRGLARVEYQFGTNDVLIADGTNSWTATLELLTGTNTVRVWSRDLSGNISTTNTRSFYYSRVPVAKGAYNGLFHEADGFRFGSSGFFKLVVTDKGTYSGSLMSGGKAYSVSGKFNPDGTATNAVVRSGTNALLMTWLLDVASLDKVTGTVNGGNWEADLAGDRAGYNIKANPARQAGKFTFTIAGQPGAAGEPEGDGFGTAIVDGNGKVTVSGILAEGTKFTQSATLSADGRWPLFASLYASKGAVVSWMSFDSMQTNQFGGVLNWFKPPLPASKYCTNGFGITNSVIGSRYVAPVGATNRILSITNGSLILSGGNRIASMTNAVILGLNSKVTNASPNKLTLSFTLSSGLFSGTFVETGSVKKVLFKGAVLQSVNRGSGFFLGTNQSGRVSFQSAP